MGLTIHGWAFERGRDGTYRATDTAGRVATLEGVGTTGKGINRALIRVKVSYPGVDKNGNVVTKVTTRHQVDTYETGRTSTEATEESSAASEAAAILNAINASGDAALIRARLINGLEVMADGSTAN